ncbi:hypothetical protein BJV74DRAFT_888890 [Russula compacta]|nr:hypothetical protein BJV74DRAFT_888890 [Russula compacta]
MSSHGTPLMQRQGSRDDVTRISGAIDELPDEILLEIFDSYRQSFEHEFDPQLWHKKSGWFNLVHVCQKWRRTVLASPSRLHLRLCFTDRSPPPTLLTHLTFLPVIIDYYTEGDYWDSSLEDHILSGFSYPDRVCEIHFEGTDYGFHVLTRAMDYPFPALEYLDFYFEDTMELELPATFLHCSAPCLQRLKLSGMSLTSLPKLLSYTTALVYLSLYLDTDYDLLPASFLLTSLRGMRCLRHLELTTSHGFFPSIDAPAPPVRMEDIVCLPELIFLLFHGYKAHFEGLLAVLAAPSLQNLHLTFSGFDDTSPILHFSRFIHSMDQPIVVVQLYAAGLRFNFSMIHSVDSPPLRISIPNGIHSIEQIGSTLSTTFASIEVLHLVYSHSVIGDPLGSLGRPISWGKLLEQFLNVKTLQMQCNQVIKVAPLLQQHDREPTLDILPSLEEIELHATEFPPSPGENSCASAFDSLQPFVAARQRAGRLVEVLWTADHSKYHL